ncbi:RNA polymerase sigma factor [Nocardiopsis ganjiahuensis]|uniref:RNA polymerase sigma factor n=1 Tax=Nocardiopsis ganjiahuensis TaxID=239984 RepID=UPI000382293E|nr:sigma-70 family RNA polymerase sigma factor [Nocardiopsis ganjiahuensis]
MLGACHGNADAWEAIVDRHLAMVNRIARSYRLPRQDHEDAVQTVWLRLNQNLPRLHSPHLLAVWLRRATNTACNRQRQHRQRFLPVDPQDLIGYAHHQADPEDQYLLQERYAELHRAIDGLTDPVDRRVARLYLDDSPDAGPISHRTTSNQRRHLFRQLRRSLRATGEPSERRA